MTTFEIITRIILVYINQDSADPNAISSAPFVKSKSRNVVKQKKINGL